MAKERDGAKRTAQFRTSTGQQSCCAGLGKKTLSPCALTSVHTWSVQSSADLASKPTARHNSVKQLANSPHRPCACCPGRGKIA